MALVKIIDIHPGRMARNGGQYGEGRLVPLKGGKVRYWSTSELPFCGKCGQYHDEESCGAEEQVMTESEVAAYMAKYGRKPADPYVDGQGVAYVIDATGHEIEADDWGGCLVCHPR